MEDKLIYKVTLSDGTELDNLEMNGNNFVSKTPVSEDIFHDNCNNVVISCGEAEELHEHMALVQVMRINSEYWFVLRDLTNEELYQMQLRSDVEYLAMMTGVDL